MFLEEYFMNLRIKGVLLSGLVFYNLQQLNIKTYRTDELGAIKVVFDGSQYECYSYRYQKECF